MDQIRVLVVDDHDLFRRGLIDILREEEDIEVVGEAQNGLEAIERTRELQPAVVFMDLNMPERNGIETTAYLTQQWPDTKVLVLTVSEEPEDLFRALGVGALGYVLKNARPSAIVDALRQVHEGWVVVSPAMAPRFIADMAQSSDPTPRSPKAPPGQAVETHLSIREIEILQHVAKGMSNAEIADTLVLSENTIKTHIKNILGKLHTKNRSEAVAYAGRMGFLDPR